MNDTTTHIEDYAQARLPRVEVLEETMREYNTAEAEAMKVNQARADAINAILRAKNLPTIITAQDAEKIWYIVSLLEQVSE